MCLLLPQCYFLCRSFFDIADEILELDYEPTTDVMAWAQVQDLSRCVTINVEDKESEERVLYTLEEIHDTAAWDPENGVGEVSKYKNDLICCDAIYVVDLGGKLLLFSTNINDKFCSKLVYSVQQKADFEILTLIITLLHVTLLHNIGIGLPGENGRSQLYDTLMHFQSFVEYQDLLLKNGNSTGFLIIVFEGVSKNIKKHDVKIFSLIQHD